MLKKYHNNVDNIDVDAFQWNGERYPGVWQPYVGLGIMRPGKHCCAIHVGSGILMAGVGDWIIQAKGGFAVCPKDRFDDIYKPID